MRKLVIGSLKHVARALGYGALGAFAALLVGFVVHLNNQPDLFVWHTVELDAEFTRDSDVDSFEDYLALEERLFRQLDELVYEKVPAKQQTHFNRYASGSRSDPGIWDRNWNRSFVLEHARPKAGVLLIHGLSDSPYSIRSAAMRLHRAGAYAVGMRVPGHGTAPSGLVRVTWEDMAAALRLGVRHVREKIGDRPLYIVGYSNGGALAVHYALMALEDGSLPRPDGLVLLSPMIGVSPAAALAIWQERIGRLLGLEKLQWNSVLQEIDPYKYGSFAINAGNQSYQLTTEIDQRLKALQQSGELRHFPRLIAFQSAVDATVSAPALVEKLMNRLSGGDHELVIFDVNRTAAAENMLKHDPKEDLGQLLRASDRRYTLSLITNVNETDRSVETRRFAKSDEPIEVTSLGLNWPPTLFSLSHIALPFPPEDPLYGSMHDPASEHVQLGDLALRGERGVLAISPSEMLRIRWNPFYSYLEARMLAFTGLE